MAPKKKKSFKKRRVIPNLVSPSLPELSKMETAHWMSVLLDHVTARESILNFPFQSNESNEEISKLWRRLNLPECAIEEITNENATETPQI